MSTETSLPQGAGYGVVVSISSTFELYLQADKRDSITQIGMGLFFSAFMIGLTKVQTRYTSLQPSNAEEFTSASRRYADAVQGIDAGADGVILR
jgi:hypothetical protein